MRDLRFRRALSLAVWNLIWRSGFDCEKAISFDTRFGPAHSALGPALIKRGDVDAGIAEYRAIIEGVAQSVVLVERAGKALYGDAAVVGALASGCDALDVCGTPKSVCTMSETGKTLAALTTSNATSYPLFFCDGPVLYFDKDNFTGYRGWEQVLQMQQAQKQQAAE